MTDTVTVNGSATSDQIAGPMNRVFIQDQLGEERAAKASLEARGQNVITSAGALATLLGGFAALAFGAGKVQLDWWDRVAMITAITLFVLAAAAASITAVPSLNWREADREILHRRVDTERWYAGEALEDARLNARTEVRILVAARTVNRTKALWLRGAVWAEVAALCSLAVAVGLLLARVH
jgi:hypothetical protein